LQRKFQLKHHVAMIVSPIVCLLTICVASTAMAQQLAASPPRSILNYEKPIHTLIAASNVDRSHVSLKVEKSRFILTVLYHARPLKSYPIVLGTNPVDDKLCEGDNCTPEGTFKIVEMRSPHKWSRFMLLNYPTAASRKRFLAARQSGKLKGAVAIGGAIGIHGVPKGFDRAIDARQNWTAGCIALKTADINEIYSLCRRGTVVHIVH